MEGKKELFDIGAFDTNTDSEENGVWIDYTSVFSVKLARINCPAYKEYMLKRTKPHVRAIEIGSVDNAFFENITKDAIAETIIKDWKGLGRKDSDGIMVEVPYSKEEARKLLDKEDFYVEIRALAQSRDFFVEDSVEEAAGN